MDESFNDYRPTDTRSAYEIDINPLNTSTDGLSVPTPWQMSRSHSSFSQPQQHGTKRQHAFGQRASLSQNGRPPRRSVGQADYNAMSANNFTFTGASSAPGSMAPPPSLHRYLQPGQPEPFYAARSSFQAAPQPFVPDFTQWRNPVPSQSELASEDVPPLTTGGDSASPYQMPTSVYSEQLHTDTPSIHGLNPASSVHFEDTTTVLSSERSGRSRRRKSRSEPRRHFVPTKCEHCDETPKTGSEQKKHMLKHQKQFRCDVFDCPREGKPFGTINDLDRHQRSVHKLSYGVSKWWRCNVPGCERPDKLWPRYDNFKHHIDKVHHSVHKGDETQIKDMCKQCEVLDPLPRQAPQPPAALPEPMSTALAGIVGAQPGQVLHPPSMQYSMNPDLLTPGTVSGMEIQSDHQSLQDNLQGTGFLDHLSPLDATSDRLSKAGPTLASTSPLSERRNSGVAKKRRRNSSGAGIAVLAEAALSAQVPTTAPQIDHPTSRERAGRSQSRCPPTSRTESRSESCHSSVSIEESSEPAAQPDRMEHANQSDHASQLDQLLQQLKSRIGEEGLFDVLKHVSSKSGSQSKKRSGNTTNSATKCRYCAKVVARPCDLKKHEIRHSKPYGCTFDHCTKVFGSKNDWKRHENSQHYQQELWRCQFSVPSNTALDGKCGLITWNAKKLRSHLRKAHDVLDEPRAQAMVAAWRIGRCGHNRYWCGYCRDIVAVSGEVRGQAAWDERFNHIDRHVKEGKRIHEWLCIEVRATKGEIESGGGDGRGAEKAGAGGAVANAAAVEDSSSEDEQPSSSQFPRRSSMTVGGSSANAAQQLARYSAAATLLPPSSGVRDEDVYQCCQCGSGPYNGSMTTKCIMSDLCDHELCFQCMM